MGGLRNLFPLYSTTSTPVSRDYYCSTTLTVETYAPFSCFLRSHCSECLLPFFLYISEENLEDNSHTYY